MKFTNVDLHEIASQYYFHKYLDLLKTRKNRREQSYQTHMTGFMYPEYGLERNVKNLLSDPFISNENKTHLEQILASGNLISDQDPNIQNYIDGAERSKQFIWPNNEENSIRNIEENTFQDFINANPTETKSNFTSTEWEEFKTIQSTYQ